MFVDQAAASGLNFTHFSGTTGDYLFPEILGSGVAVFVMALNTLGFLSETRDAYYDRYRFADVFASVSRAPNPLTERIEEIAGIADVQTRIVSNVTLDVPGLEEPAVGHLVSLPDDSNPN